jgi:hypothetical protein
MAGGLPLHELLERRLIFALNFEGSKWPALLSRMCDASSTISLSMRGLGIPPR